MKAHKSITGLLTAVLLLTLAVGVTRAQGPGDPPVVLGGPPLTDTFTYQGYLVSNGLPADGVFDFQVEVYDAQTLGNSVATFQVFDDQVVQDGIFTFYLFPSIGMDELFNGDPRWIEVRVKPDAEVVYTTLPRQPITPVPYAWGLRAGANVVGNLNDAVLHLENTYNANTYGPALHAVSNAPTSPTVAGYHNGDGPGIYGYTEGAYPAVEGFHGADGIAVGGYTAQGVAVHGSASSTNGFGVVGTQPGYSTSDLTGWYESGGFFGGDNGVVGVTKNGLGYGVFGYNQAASGGFAAYFLADHGTGVYVSAPGGQVGLSVASGTKNAVVRTDKGSRLLYTEESTEVWFTDYGFGTLKEGRAVIAIDPLFAQTVNLDAPYHVFVQVYGDAELYVSGRTAEQFEVHVRDGDPNVEFSYRIVAKRLGYEGDRLEPAPWADNDINLYPEKAAEGGTMQGGQP